MTHEEKTAFFEFMAHDLEINPDDVISSLAESTKRNRPKARTVPFAAACEPRRQELARRLNQVPGATGQLVQMRKGPVGQ
jgi:malonyl-CoA decarboxylase